MSFSEAEKRFKTAIIDIRDRTSSLGKIKFVWIEQRRDSEDG